MAKRKPDPPPDGAESHPFHSLKRFKCTNCSNSSEPAGNDLPSTSGVNRRSNLPPRSRNKRLILFEISSTPEDGQNIHQHMPSSGDICGSLHSSHDSHEHVQRISINTPSDWQITSKNLQHNARNPQNHLGEHIKATLGKVTTDKRLGLPVGSQQNLSGSLPNIKTTLDEKPESENERDSIRNHQVQQKTFESRRSSSGHLPNLSLKIDGKKQQVVLEWQTPSLQYLPDTSQRSRRTEQEQIIDQKCLGFTPAFNIILLDAYSWMTLLLLGPVHR